MQAYSVKCLSIKYIKFGKTITVVIGKPATQWVYPTYGTKVFR